MVRVKTGFGAIATGALLTTACAFFLVFFVGTDDNTVFVGTVASQGTAETIVGTKVICPDDVTIATLFKELIEDELHIISEPWIVQKVCMADGSTATGGIPALYRANAFSCFSST